MLTNSPKTNQSLSHFPLFPLGDKNNQEEGKGGVRVMGSEVTAPSHEEINL